MIFATKGKLIHSEHLTLLTKSSPLKWARKTDAKFNILLFPSFHRLHFDRSARTLDQNLLKLCSVYLTELFVLCWLVHTKILTNFHILQEDWNKKESVAGLEPGTFDMQGHCHNHYTTWPLTLHQKPKKWFLKYENLWGFSCARVNIAQIIWSSKPNTILRGSRIRTSQSDFWLWQLQFLLSLVLWLMFYHCFGNMLMITRQWCKHKEILQKN